MKHYLIIFCFLSSFVVTAVPNPVCAQNGIIAAVPKLQTGDELIHFGDVIDVDVVGGFEFDWRGTLTPEGFLEGLDGYTEPIYGLCRSETDVAAEISKLLGRTLRDPKVVVRILDRSNRAVVRLDGAVRTATRFQIKRPVRLRELIVMAGGLIDGASGDVSIFRPKNLSCRPLIQPVAGTVSDPEPAQDNASAITTIKISDLISGKSAADPQILSGDLITVNRALPIYVIGAVINPRPIFSRDKMTLTRLIASAGGLAKDADGSKVFIFRRDGLEVRSIEADLNKIKNGNSDDEVLRPFDIIEVASKGGSRRKYPPVVANEQIVDRSRQELPLRVVD
ncbi:MAG: SLBB domain-containing protein [Pyrinomonadaceae bacterium]